MAIPELIYCADGNRRFAEIAIEAGFTYGAQMPNTVYHPPEFCDQDWRNPDLEAYAAALAKHRPRLATVLDYERSGQRADVMMWAETVAPYVETIVIIPKVPGTIETLPRTIGGKPVRLGYSVPTSYGGTPVSIREFAGWPVHLLGGSPIEQRRLARKMNVASLDGNYHHLMATRYNQFFVPDGSANFAVNRYWPTLREANGGKLYGDGSDTAGAPYEAFRRSCEAIWAYWHGKPYKRYYPFTIPAF